MIKKELQKEIIRIYDETKSIKEISIKMQLSRWVISNILKKNNIITNRSHRKIKINENLFSNINHDSSYLIGLICSDGSIDNNGYGFQISSKDIEILEYCKQILESEHKICKISSFDKRTNKTYIRYNIHFCSKKLVDDLNKLGIYNNKSFNCLMPSIPDEYFWSFLRGLFDGDGWVSGYNNRYNIGIVCTESILKKITDVFRQNNISINKPRIVSKNDDGIIYAIKQNSYDHVSYIRDKMYEHHNGFFLKRKHLKLSNLRKGVKGKNSHINKVWKKVLCTNIISKEEIMFDSIKDCANFLGYKKRFDYLHTIIKKSKTFKNYNIQFI